MTMIYVRGLVRNRRASVTHGEDLPANRPSRPRDWARWLGRRGPSVLARAERGTTVLEIVIAAAIISFLVTILMPPLNGYAGTAAMRQSALQAVQDFREAQEIAAAQQTVPIIFWLGKIYPPPTGWQVIETPCSQAACAGQQGSLLYAFTVPPPAHLVAYCNLTTFDGEGRAAVAGCPVGSAQNPGNGVATILCIDNGAGAQGEQIQMQVTLASGAVREVQSAGTCP